MSNDTASSITIRMDLEGAYRIEHDAMMRGQIAGHLNEYLDFRAKHFGIKRRGRPWKPGSLRYGRKELDGILWDAVLGAAGYTFRLQDPSAPEALRAFANRREGSS